MEVLRQNGWTLTIEGDRWWANKERGAVKVRLKFAPETELYSSEVERWADHFGLTRQDV